MPPNFGGAPPRGIASQPSMSSLVMHAEKMNSGSLVWKEHSQKVWVLVEVLSQENTMLRVRHKATREEEEVDLGFGETYPHNPKVVADMTALHHIHEAGILHNLGQRAQLKSIKPYTFMGTILIAVNPLCRVEDPPMDDYMNRSLNPDTPHPYAIAELAYHQMRLGAGRKATNQSIVVSGESGAGKTETSKIILRFLTHRSVGGVSGLEQKVVDTSPILESFGNAKTLRNNNSSRFGKFLKMQFTKDKYRLAGAFIETYLLEKSRVLTQGQGERNFHVLYELVAGASKAGLAKELKLDGDVEKYRILSDSGCTVLDGVDDAEQFEGVRAACGTIGMDDATQIQVWRALAAVLHLSNVTFDGKDHEQGEIAAVKDSAALASLSALLGVEPAPVESMLTQRVVNTRGEVFTKQLGVQDANRTRDAIVKSLYEALFLWMVRLINTSLGKGEDSLPFIGVLDIFGFENFDTKNEFEQLLINFTNESLQDTFNKQVFNNELKLYEEEGIEVTVSSCPDNAECLAMLSDKPNGVITSLDAVCAEPEPSDDRYLLRLHKTFDRHQHFPRTKPKDKRECFSVKHYAGSVKYTVGGWVERNMDRIPQAFSGCLSSSTHQVVREMVETYGAAAPPAAARGGGARNRKSTLVRPTVAKAFLSSMRELNETLLGTTCNFVRCIKPNAEMQCGVYDNKYVVEQLQCLGILQTCEVLKVGMPTRVTYADLKEVLGDQASEADKLFKGEPETALIASILWAFEVPSEAFRLGRTRVFFRAGQISTVQKILNETTPDKAPWIFKRLQEALANRQKAKAAAQEAETAMSEAEQAVKTAEDTSLTVLGATENGDADGLVENPPRSSSASGVSEDDLRPLESAARNARAAGSTAPQIKAMVDAAEEDKMGRYAPGAMDRVVAGSKDALEKINRSAAKGAELERMIAEVRGGDEATVLRRLAEMLRVLRSDFKVAKQAAQMAGEAAAKCQVDRTRVLTDEAKGKASKVASQARAVTGVADSAARVSERQQAAFAKAKAVAESAKAAGEEARTAFSSFKSVLVAANAEEEAARVEKLAAADKEAEEKRKKENQRQDTEKAAAAAAAATSAKLDANASSSSGRGEAGDDVADLVLPSAAPANRRASAIAREPSMSVKNLLGSSVAKSPVASPSPSRESSSGGFGSSVQVEKKPIKRPQPERSMSQRFNEAMEEGYMEGHLMTQMGRMKRWAKRYFVLDNGFLSHYEKKSVVGTKKHKRMELTGHSMTQRTSQMNTFSVRTESMEWLILTRSKGEMEEWMEVINEQIHALFIRQYNVPEDDYRSQGKAGQFFYKMAARARPQWIRRFPLKEAPRTGDGLFEGEIIEVSQVLTNDDVHFLRMANNRGWATVRDIEGGSKPDLFTEVSVEVVRDTREYMVPAIASQPAVVIFGPGAESQETGKTLMPSVTVRVVQKATLKDGVSQAEQGMSFVKLKSRRGGWVPIMKGNGIVGVVPLKSR